MFNTLGRLFRVSPTSRAADDGAAPSPFDRTQRRFVEGVLDRGRTPPVPPAAGPRWPLVARLKGKPVHFKEVERLRADWMRHGGKDRADRLRDRTRAYLETTASLPPTAKLQTNRGVAQALLDRLNGRRVFRPRARPAPSLLASLAQLLCCLPIRRRRAGQRHAGRSRRL